MGGPGSGRKPEIGKFGDTVNKIKATPEDYENYIINKEPKLYKAIERIKDDIESKNTLIDYSKTSAILNGILTNNEEIKDLPKDYVNKERDRIQKMDSIFNDIPKLENDLNVLRGQSLKDKDINIYKDNVGKEISYDGFTSTTTDEEIADYFSSDRSVMIKDEKDVIMEIKVNKGNKVIPVGMVAERMKTEKEFLLNRNQKYKVISVKEKNNKVNVKLELLNSGI